MELRDNQFLTFNVFERAPGGEKEQETKETRGTNNKEQEARQTTTREQQAGLNTTKEQEPGTKDFT